MFRQLLDWLEDRTGVESAVKHFLYEDIPASSGWHQVFGSVALFAFLLQVVTGILLALNYAPTPPEAYDSLRYIMTQVTAGRFMRAMHHWGASLMIVIVVLHMIQTFLWGSYKKPREATWIAGVVLLLLTSGIRTERLSAALGQSGLLGHRRHHPDLGAGARRGAAAGPFARQRWHFHRRHYLHAFLRGPRAASAAANRVADRHSRLLGPPLRRRSPSPGTSFSPRKSSIPSK